MRSWFARSFLVVLSPPDPDASSVCSLITEGAEACGVVRREDLGAEDGGVCEWEGVVVCVVGWDWAGNS